MNRLILHLSLLLFFIFSACENGIKKPDNLIQFESEKLGMESSENELTVRIPFSREIEEKDTIVLSVAFSGLEYGTHFTTDPAMDKQKISLPAAVNASFVSFKVKKVDGVFMRGDEEIEFVFNNFSSQLVLGSKSKLTFSFIELIFEGGIMSPNVGGESEPNTVFVDLSANRQKKILRDAWDLGFYTEENQFKVKLNSFSGMMARPLDKMNIDEVTAADTVGFGAQLSNEAVFAALIVPNPPNWVLNDAVKWIDDPSGDVTKMAIMDISENNDENKVYIVNRGTRPDGTQRGWKKIRVLRNRTEYLLQHADIDVSTFAVTRIASNTDYSFNYINFDTGSVEVEPKKEQWDIAFTSSYATVLGPAFGLPVGAVVPYFQKDMVLQNFYVAVKTAEVLITPALSYPSFSEADIQPDAFTDSQIAIGDKWRDIPQGPQGGGISLKTDRFYVVSDPKGNIYKLRFTAVTQDGERGRPEFEFELVKKVE